MLSKGVPGALFYSFITRGGEGREDKDEDRKATRSEGRGPEESRALMRRSRRVLVCIYRSLGDNFGYIYSF